MRIMRQRVVVAAAVVCAVVATSIVALWAGVLWSPPLAPEAAVTAVIATYHRPESMWRSAVANLCNSEHIAHVVLVWNNGEYEPPPAAWFDWRYCGRASVSVWQPSNASSHEVQNRYQAVVEQTATGGVLIIDDDILVSDWDVGRLVAAWRRRPDAVHGFKRRLIDCRHHDGDDGGDDGGDDSGAANATLPGWHCTYHMAPPPPPPGDLSGYSVYNAAIGQTLLMHRRFIAAYWAATPLRRLVADANCCDDIAVQFLVANATVGARHQHAPVAALTPSLLHRNAGKALMGFAGKQREPHWRNRRAGMAERLCTFYGGFPLRPVVIDLAADLPATDGGELRRALWSHREKLRWRYRRWGLSEDDVGTPRRN